VLLLIKIFDDALLLIKVFNDILLLIKFSTMVIYNSLRASYIIKK